MRLIALATLVTPFILAACGPGPGQIVFTSEKEKACYDQARAKITNPNTKLQRSQDGTFVRVTTENGFVRDIDPSITFERCMASSNTTGTPVQNLGEGLTVTLSAEEQAIWNTLSDTKKREALLFKQQGGNLRDFARS